MTNIIHNAIYIKVQQVLKLIFSGKVWVAWLVLVLGLFATIFASTQVKQEIEIDAVKQFTFTCDQIALKIQERLGDYTQALQGGAALFSVSGNVARQEWKDYVEPLRSQKNLIGVQGIRFNQFILANKLTQHIAHIRGEGFSEYSVHPSGSRSFYTPTVYIEPFSGANLRAFGYDSFSEPARRLAMEQARDTGNPEISGKIVLFQETVQGYQSDIEMYVPVYQKGFSLNTMQQRRAAIIGWVSAPYLMSELMAGILSDWAKHEGKVVGLAIYDGLKAMPAAQLFDSDPSNILNPKSLFYQHRIINFNNHQWLLEFGHLSKESDINYINAWVILFSGIIISCLLFGLIISIIRTRTNALQIAQKLNEELILREQLLRASENHLRLSQESGGICTWEADLINNTQVWSENCMSLLGFATLLNPTWEDFLALVLPEDRQHVIDATQSHIENNTKYDVEYRVTAADGETRWMRSTGQAEYNTEGCPIKMRGVAQDINERKLTENALRIAATAFESQEGIIVTDANNHILRVNSAFMTITGYTEEEAAGQTPALLSSGRQDKAFYNEMWERLKKTGRWEGEIWNKRKSGEIYPEYLKITVVKDAAGMVTNYVASLTDITINHAAADKIKYLAFYDTLTQLPNRRLLLDRLNQARTASVRSGQRCAIMFIDLDNFKALNDTLGHDIGDLLLQQVAVRLTANIRENDTVSRIGGDEFVVILENLSKQDVEAATYTKDIAEKILLSLSHPYQLNKHTYHSTVSIGATLFNGHQQDPRDLLKQADIAMYQSKTEGRNTLHFFDPKMQKAIKVRVDMENELRKAIEKNQFQLHYQVQVDISGQAFGAEVLIRWQHPEQGIISPFNFIPLAEETGLIFPIGQWVLDTACAQLKIWQQNPLTQDLVLAVNVSAKQFHQVDFLENIQASLQRHSINPNRLKLELTESMLVKNINDIIAKMSALKKIGISFSLDDFGTGYSSLQYLKKLPLHQLKIDQSFVRDILIDNSDRAIVCTIINMSRSLGIDVIAEGVETLEQRQCLLDNGCMYFQGYLFSKPLPIDEFEALLSKSSLINTPSAY